MKRLASIACAATLALLTGCSESATESANEPAKPAEPISARSAVHQMWVKARSWAPDCKPLRVSNMDLKEVKSQGGKAGAWEATFVSESRRRARRYTYSVVDNPASNLSKGAFGGAEESYSPAKVKPFLIQAFKTDSTAAYETAMTKGKGAEYSKKNPDMPMLFLLEWTGRFPNPAWRVIWGESVSRSNFSVFVDAATGEYLQTVR